jgi:hypothetical protein
MNTKQQNRQPRPTWRQYRALKDWSRTIENEARLILDERDQLRAENESLKKQLHIEKMVATSLEAVNRSNHEAGMRYLEIIGNLTQKLAGLQQAK